VIDIGETRITLTFSFITGWGERFTKEQIMGYMERVAEEIENKSERLECKEIKYVGDITDAKVESE